MVQISALAVDNADYIFYTMSQSLVVENYRVIFEDCSPSELSLLVIDQNTAETFRAEHFPLLRIKPITISAAFKHENSTLTYEFLRDHQTLQLVIKVAVEYMPPFDETISLKRVENAGKEVMLQEIKVEVDGLYKTMQKVLKKNPMVIGSFNGAVGEAGCKVELKQGTHLVEGFGIVTSGYDQNGGYDEQNGNYSQFNFIGKLTVTLRLQYSSKQKIEEVAFNYPINTNDSMQTPFSFMRVFKVDSPAFLYVRTRCENVGGPILSNAEVYISEAFQDER